MGKVIPIGEMLKERWRQKCLQELSKNWRMSPEDALDTLLLEGYLQMIRDKAQPLTEEQVCDYDE